jgi:GT2 family glycosyltransferase
MIKTAIVILNWNGAEYLKKFLDGVVRYSASEGTDIYIADNGSTDGSVEWVSANFSTVKIILLEKNHGFAGGYNLALGKIDAKYYLLLNSDVEVTPGWLTPLTDYMEKNPDVASCQPKILSFYNKEQFEYAGAAGGYIDKYGYPFCRGRIFDKVEKDKGQYDSPADIFWSTGACMLVRAEAWKKCSGFDADFFAHMEEIDLCWRFGKAGYRIVFIPESVVYHVGGGSLPYNSPYKTFLNFRNSLFLLYKNLPDKNFRSTLFVRKILDGIAAVMFLLKGNTGSFKAVWNAHIAYYAVANELKIKREAIKKTEHSNNTLHILNKSIVFEFYVKGKKTYNSIQTTNILR